MLEINLAIYIFETIISMKLILSRLLFPWLFWIYALLFILSVAFEVENVHSVTVTLTHWRNNIIELRLQMIVF
jgi:uncharacterized integral membrane protein